ncbi:hypothetical protein OY187_27920 [Mycolicibacterium iranicum]|uniref:Uncharacterized protein n=1 Tax=Mycolicibacterium iranicum TaxID=912594 RepID=A0ABT4HNT9_MYCIR|nr:hypothetical protein [Mycolicibacterium iranicum]
MPGDDAEQQAGDDTSDADGQADAAAGDDTTQDGDGDQPETFPREYVEKLRKESAGYRERAQQADQLAQRLHTALVAATGRLADPTDLPFDAEHLDDPDALNAAIDELVERKPHLKSRRVVGDVGQGAGSVKAGQVNLAEILRARA